MHLQALTQHTEKAVRAGEKKTSGEKKKKIQPTIHTA